MLIGIFSEYSSVPSPFAILVAYATNHTQTRYQQFDKAQMTDQLNQIKEKLDRLKKLDRSLHAFGAEKHKYKLNKIKSERELTNFEKEHKITLPTGYREFIKQIGNGGAGPYFGLEPIENGIYADLDYKNADHLNDLSKPFPHTQHWNLDFGEVTSENEDEYFRKKDKEYFQNKWTNGILRVSNFGCGVSLNLVVNGKEYGNMWVDDRCNDQGIYPNPYFDTEGRVTFLNWYELWLDKELKERKAGNNGYNSLWRNFLRKIPIFK